MKYDHVARDLARKAADDVSATIKRTLDLTETDDQREAVAIMVTGVVLGYLGGVFAATRGLEQDASMEVAVELLTRFADPKRRAEMLRQASICEPKERER